MISSENKIQIRYDEVDKMGYVYHGNYAKYYHISRTELMRGLGFSDKEFENYNIIMPIIELNIKYLKPVYYDDNIVIKTTLKQLPDTRMKFYHEVRNESNVLINTATSTVVFVNMESRLPMRAPEFFVEKLKLHFDDEN